MKNAILVLVSALVLSTTVTASAKKPARHLACTTTYVLGGTITTQVKRRLHQPARIGWCRADGAGRKPRPTGLAVRLAFSTQGRQVLVL